MAGPLIGPEQDFALWAVLIGLAAFGFWCERYSWGRRFSGVMLLITAAIVLSNLRVIPTAAPAYELTWNYLVPVAIPLLLFQADIRRILRESGPTLIAFVIGSAAVVAGAVLGLWALNLGPAEPELGGVFSATYIGGSLNFAAVAEATGFRDSSLLTAAVAADNVATNLHFLLLIALPGVVWFSAHFPRHHSDRAGESGAAPGERPHRIADLDLAGLLAGLALAFGLAALGKVLAALAGMPQFAILIVTFLALVVGTALPRQVAKLSGHAEAGTALMFIFLASIGASADIWQLIGIAPILFAFAAIIIGVHLAVLFGLGKLLRLDLAELITASAACIGGPASAAAIASAKGWRELVIPGVLCGSLGYAVGSFIGVALVQWMR